MNTQEYGTQQFTGQVVMVVGVIFLLLIMAGVYIYTVDPMGLRPALSGDATVNEQSGAVAVSETDRMSESQSAGGFTLSAAQVEALVALGVDPSAIPAEVSAAQENCFIEALGAERVAEVKAGAVPGPLEFMRAQSCI